MEAVPGAGREFPVLLLEDVQKVYNPGPLEVLADGRIASDVRNAPVEGEPPRSNDLNLAESLAEEEVA